MGSGEENDEDVVQLLPEVTNTRHQLEVVVVVRGGRQHTDGLGRIPRACDVLQKAKMESSCSNVLHQHRHHSARAGVPFLLGGGSDSHREDQPREPKVPVWVRHDI